MTADTEPQAAAAVLMVRPDAFASNPQTLASNSFQARAPRSPDMQRRAELEFDAAVAALEAVGVRVHAFAGREDCDAPDEVFPNNWVSFHADGSVVLYPMLAPNRRLERRPDLIAALEREHGYTIRQLVDLTANEVEGRFLEGTGSLVLDRANRVAYACGSPRTELGVLADFVARLGYESFVFAATDAVKRPVYHTNIVMSVGSSFAIVCLEAVADAAQRAQLTDHIAASTRTLIEISLGQMHDFAANILELAGTDGPVIALSEHARRCLDAAQTRALERCGSLVSVAIPTIEAHGGGSLRCMLAEVHLPG